MAPVSDSIDSHHSRFQMFLAEPRPEAATLSLLRSIMGFGIESRDVRVTDAVGFPQIALHPRGYAQSWSITWPADVALRMDLQELAHRVAMSLDVSVLLEPESEEGGWRAFSPDGSSLEVEVDHLEDGVDVSYWGRES